MGDMLFIPKDLSVCYTLCHTVSWDLTALLNMFIHETLINTWTSCPNYKDPPKQKAGISGWQKKRDCKRGGDLTEKSGVLRCSTPSPKDPITSQMMIGVYNHLLRKVFRFHYHSEKVIGSLGFNASIKHSSFKDCLEHEYLWIRP